MLLSFPHPSTSICFPSQKNPKPSKKHLILLPRSSIATRPESASTSAIQRIAEKLRSLGYLEPNSNPTAKPPTGAGSAGEIFVPTPQELPKQRVGYTIDSSWSTPENPVPEPGAGLTRFRELWRKNKEESRAVKKREERVPMVAELTIPAAELKRLRSVGIRLEKRLKVGKAGITEGIINGIHERWQRSELVKIKCEDLCRMNMKRTHEILERKTGGLVVWRSGSIIILYRGVDYTYPYFHNEDNINTNLKNISEDPSVTDVATMEHEGNSSPASDVNPLAKSPHNLSHPSLVGGVGSPNKVRLQLPGEVQLEEEADCLLDGLGPRFTDWWGYEPLPVDADLLPATVPGFRKPFRLLPFGVKPKLTDREMTVLRRLSRPLPCHFALGRNRKLQGLAVSMIKLWEKCEVAKIAVKRGVQNTNSEIMAEELKQLTGGVLLSRDKEFIVFYRGKDFLPSAVSIAIEKRRNTEVGRQKPSSHNSPTVTTSSSPLTVAGQASVDALPVAIKETWSTPIRRGKTSSLAIKRVETQLAQALEKRERAEELLGTLEKSVEHPVLESDKEAISEEERYMLRRVGLTMKPFLLLGRRGVFTGTVENMHLHWKYRELVKIISKERSIEQVEIDARTLEAESGGILVAVERVNKGHAIIIYRGKNYRRPADLRPNTLLSKKQAMRRSLEAQRCASLKLHVLSLSKNIVRLQHQMAKESSVVDTMQLTEGDDKSDAVDESNELSFSIESYNGSAGSSDHQENSEEVNEAAAEYLVSDKRDCVPNEDEESTIRSSNSVTNSKFHLNLWQQDTWISSEQVDELRKNENDQPEQDNWIAFEQVDEICKNENEQPPQDNWIPPAQVDVLSKNKNDRLAIEPTNSTNMPYVHAEHIFNEPDFPSEPCQQEQISISATNSLSHFSSEEEATLSFGTARDKMDTHVHDDTPQDDSQLENCFRAAPLSNRERLILRKQALKMRKRPVLAVGRSNIVTGVAKTIKTHFEKHPLAIVNIKGRAEGTSVQEVIFELEQATGAVLVSREPNKVILYRGWGEGEAPPGGSPREKKDARKGSWRVNEEEVSPKLMDAIRVECGLSIGRLE